MLARSLNACLAIAVIAPNFFRCRECEQPQWRSSTAVSALRLSASEGRAGDDRVFESEEDKEDEESASDEQRPADEAEPPRDVQLATMGGERYAVSGATVGECRRSLLKSYPTIFDAESVGRMCFFAQSGEKAGGGDESDEENDPFDDFASVPSGKELFLVESEHQQLTRDFLSAFLTSAHERAGKDEIRLEKQRRSFRYAPPGLLSDADFRWS